MDKTEQYAKLLDDDHINKIRLMRESNPNLEFNVSSNKIPICIKDIYQSMRSNLVKTEIQKKCFSLGTDKRADIRDILHNYSADVLKKKSITFMNIVDSKDLYIGYEVVLNDGQKINMIFLMSAETIKTDSLQMIHLIDAVTAFGNTFEGKYDKLLIIILLDSSKRIVPADISDMTDKQKIAELQRRYLAMSVSGVTYSSRNLIILTKTEEIIKLLFHELIHYIKWDDELYSIHFKTKWGLDKSQQDLNVSEAYAEFLSVIIYIIFESIHIYLFLFNESTQTSWEQIFHNLYETECLHGAYLSAKVLKFYGFNKQTFMEFFEGTNKTKLNQPIYLAEYIMCRSILMFNAQEILLDILPKGTNLKISSKYVPKILGIIRNDHILTDLIGQYIDNISAADNSLSYLATEFSIVKCMESSDKHT